MMRTIHRLEEIFLAHASFLDERDATGRIERPITGRVDLRLGEQGGLREVVERPFFEADHKRLGGVAQEPKRRKLRIPVVRIVAAGLYNSILPM